MWPRGEATQCVRQRCWYFVGSLNLATRSVAKKNPLLNFSNAIFRDGYLSVTKSIANILEMDFNVLVTEFFVAKTLIFCSGHLSRSLQEIYAGS